MSDIQIVPENSIRQLHCLGVTGDNSIQCIGAKYGSGEITRTTNVYVNHAPGYDPEHTGTITCDDGSGGSASASSKFPVGSVVYNNLTGDEVGTVTASTSSTITIGGGTLAPLVNNSRFNAKTTMIMAVADSDSESGAGKEITVGMNIAEVEAAAGATFPSTATVKTITYNAASTVVVMSAAATADVSSKEFMFTKPIVLLGISMINKDAGQERSVRFYSNIDGRKATVAATACKFNHTLGGGGRDDSDGTSVDYGWANQSVLWLPGGLFLTYPKFVAEKGNDGDDDGNDDVVLDMTLFYQNQDNSKAGDNIAAF